MSHLFDTHLLIWALRQPSKLSTGIAALMDDNSLERCFSVASVWETAIKNGLNRPDFGLHPQVMRKTLIEVGFKELGIGGSHALAVRDLPLIHRDPFDRMLVAQAMTEGLTLVTADKTLARYPARVILM